MLLGLPVRMYQRGLSGFSKFSDSKSSYSLLPPIICSSLAQSKKSLFLQRFEQNGRYALSLDQATVCWQLGQVMVSCFSVIVFSGGDFFVLGM